MYLLEHDAKELLASRGVAVPAGCLIASAGELREFKRIGALLLMARKPDLRSPAPGYQIY